LHHSVELYVMIVGEQYGHISASRLWPSCGIKFHGYAWLLHSRTSRVRSFSWLLRLTSFNHLERRRPSHCACRTSCSFTDWWSSNTMISSPMHPPIGWRTVGFNNTSLSQWPVVMARISP
jgi:hypothetical protein